jgi:hypothetical protein
MLSGTTSKPPHDNKVTSCSWCLTWNSCLLLFYSCMRPSTTATLKPCRCCTTPRPALTLANSLLPLHPQANAPCPRQPHVLAPAYTGMLTWHSCLLLFHSCLRPSRSNTPKAAPPRASLDKQSQRCSPGIRACCCSTPVCAPPPTASPPPPP